MKNKTACYWVIDRWDNLTKYSSIRDGGSFSTKTHGPPMSNRILGSLLARGIEVRSPFEYWSSVYGRYFRGYDILSGYGEGRRVYKGDRDPRCRESSTQVDVEDDGYECVGCGSVSE